MTEIVLERCLLRAWRPADAASLVRQANDREVWLNLRDAFPHPYTAADARAWLAGASKELPLREFAVVVAGQAVGGVGFRVGLDVAHRSAEIGYWLGRAFWGRGIMSEVVPAVTAHAWRAADLCRLEARVYQCNPASARVLEKAGYVCEGRLRRAVTKDGRTIDAWLYAAVREI